MNKTVHSSVASPPPRPVLIFDGDCNFCRRWVGRWHRLTGDRVEYVPYQNASVVARFPELSPDRMSKAVHLVTEHGAIYHSAEAALRAAAYGPGPHRIWWCYRHVPGFALLSEFAYRIVANHRMFFSRLTRLHFGDAAK